MEHNHAHISEHQSKTRLLITTFIVAAIMVAEVVGGILSNSLALLGDAGHMLVDILALGLSLFAINLAARPATPGRTFGYHRVEIMAALANGVLLVMVSVYIFFEAYQRFRNPPVVDVPLMLIIAVIGLIANIIGIFMLRDASHGNLNIKAAFWHILGDSISSVGVVAGGVIIYFTSWEVVDPIIAVLIGCIILWGAVRLVRESTDILMESVPKQMPVEKVVELMKSVPGVDEVHDIHIWTITSGIYALSAHIMIEDQSVSSSGEIMQALNAELSRQFNITHTTLQMECEKCATCPGGLICQLSREQLGLDHADH